MPLADDLADLIPEYLWEPLAWRDGRRVLVVGDISGLQRQDNPPRLTDRVDSIALAQGHFLPFAIIKPPRDVGDEDLAELGGGDFLGVEGHIEGLCKPHAMSPTGGTDLALTTLGDGRSRTYSTRRR